MGCQCSYNPRLFNNHIGNTKHITMKTRFRQKKLRSASLVLSRKHGRGTRGAAPASDTAGRGDTQGTPLPARPAATCHMDPTWFSPTRADAASTQADSPGIRPTRAWIGHIGRNGRFRPKFKKKKKKGAERTVWLNTKPYFNPVSLKRQNTSPHISSHFTKFTLSLCSLPLCLCFVSLATSIHSFFSSLLRILNSGIIIKLSILV